MSQSENSVSLRRRAAPSVHPAEHYDRAACIRWVVLAAGIFFSAFAASARASIINGDFETNGFTSSPAGWNSSHVFITTQTSYEPPGIVSVVSNGTSFALLNFESTTNIDSNFLSQTAVADGSVLKFSWNRLRSSYVSNGGPTLQLSYQDLTTGDPLQVLNLDFAPSGIEPNGTQPWRDVLLSGFAVGHNYALRINAGPSVGVTATLNHDIYYMVDNVVFVPEPSSFTLLAIPLLMLAGCRRRFGIMRAK